MALPEGVENAVETIRFGAVPEYEGDENFPPRQESCSPR